MSIRRARWLVQRLALVAPLIAAGSAPAHAAEPVLHADIRVGRPIDVASFSRSVTARYHIAIRQIVAADIDRDGDLDLVSATDHGLLVWLNDGAGHLTTAPPTPSPGLDGDSSGSGWHERSTNREEPVQDDVPAPPMTNARAHAPPAGVSTRAASIDCLVPSAVWRGSSTPRAPPSDDSVR